MRGEFTRMRGGFTHPADKVGEVQTRGAEAVMRGGRVALHDLVDSHTQEVSSHAQEVSSHAQE
eukprot:156820-Prorocentrum_minimum.AAC.1